MAKKKRDQQVSALEAAGSPEELEAAVRAVARSIAKRLDEYPDPDRLAKDEEFISASEHLVADDIPTAFVEKLARSTPIVAAIAHRATAQRDAVSDDWLEFAFKRARKAYAGELAYLLDAIERHGQPPFVPSVLARANKDWHWGWYLTTITAFVERRVRAGENPTVEDLAAVVDPGNEEHVAAAVGALESVLPPATIEGFERWREDREHIAFFRTFARMWESSQEEPALTSVGGREAVVSTLEATLREPRGRSLLLVGEHGVGKTAVLRDVLDHLSDEGWIVFQAGAAEVNAGQSFIGELEGRVRQIAEHMSGRRAVWVVPAFEEMLWAGQHSRNPHGLLDSLLPYVEAREIVIVGKLEPQAYELVVQQRPRLTAAFDMLRLEPLDRSEAIAVASHWREHADPSIDDDTIAEAYDLAEHYIARVAAPGRLLRLLRAARLRAVHDGRDGLRSADLLETLSEATGLPLHVVDPDAPLDLEDVRRFFAERVLGQPEAVECLVDRIALIKAGLTDSSRPLGVFLFVGPTGTGKTEIAKALAEFLFGSPDRLVRLDMSEFQSEQSFERLLADATSQHEAATLISSVRANPFSVVLLDEFEKAHRNIWSLFLQVFDDGRLTDSQGRTADFRQCVVIMTSNLGAAVDRPRSLGFAPEDGPRFRPAAVERALQETFRPEFVNRIDRIVVFQPFEREQIRALLERELTLVLERRGFRNRPWAVEWDDSALELLAEKGFSPELGARPLKRAIERYLLAPLATTIVSHDVPDGEQFLFVTARGERIEVTFVDPDAEPDEPAEPGPSETTGELRLEQLVLDPAGGSAEAEFLRVEAARLREVIDGDGWRGRKDRDLEAMHSAGFWESGDRVDVLARVEYVDRVQAAFRSAEKLLGRLPQERNGHRARDVVELLAGRLYLLDRACVGVDPGEPSDAFLEISWRDADDGAEPAFQLREMYEAWSRRRGMRLTRLPAAAAAHRLAVSGIGAHRILAPESGLHVFESPQDDRSFERVMLHVTVAPSAPASPDADLAAHAGAALRDAPASRTIVRRYRMLPSPLVRDSVRGWRTGRIDRVLAGEFDVITER